MNTAKQPDDFWDTATGEEDKRPIAYRFRTRRPNGSAHTRYPHAVQIVWAYDSADPNGMPAKAIHEQQLEFERALQPISEGVGGVLMLVSNGNGRKEWLFYASHPLRWVDAMSALLEGHETYPLKIDYWDEAGWDTWQGFADSIQR